MPSWRKLVVSGSDASLNSLNITTFVSASSFSGQFTGSFKGDGSQLTGITATIAEQTSFSQAFTNVTSSTVNHNLNVDFPLVQIYGSDNEQLIPKTIRVNDSNILTVEFESNETGNIIIAKGGHVVSFNAPNSNTLNNQSGSYYLDWNNFTNVPSGILSSSAQIATQISGAFTLTSSSLSSRVSSLETFSSSLDSTYATDSQLTSVSSSLASDITSADSRLDTLEGKTLISSSAQVSLNGITGTTFANSNFTFPLDLTVEGTLTAEKFITEYVSSSIVYESGSTKFGDSLDDKHQFTGSVEVLGGITGSLYGTALTASYYDFSNTGILSSSAQIATEISGAFISVSSSIAGDITGLDNRLDTLEGKTLLSSSAQIGTEISGAFISISGAFSSRISDLELFSSSLDSTYATDLQLSNLSSSLSGEIVSLDGRLNSLEGKTLLSSSQQIATEISGAFRLTSSSLASRVEFFENKTVLSSSAQIATEISGAFTSISGGLSIRLNDLELFSSSLDNTYATDSQLTSVSSSLALTITSVSGRVTTLENKTLLSSSAQIAVEISGAFTSTSSSLSFDVSSLDSRLDTLEGKTLVSSSSQVNLNQLSGTTFNTADFTFPQNLTVEGTLTAEKFITEYITSSVIFESGSTKFGDSLDDTHQFTGSIKVLGGITGSLLGEASAVEYSNVLNKPALLSSSAQIATEISGAFTSISSSIAIETTALDVRLDNLEAKTLVSSSNQISEFMILAVSDENTALTTGIGKLTFRVPFTMNLYQIPRASLTSGSTSGNVVVDINSGSISILGGTKLTIDQTQKTSTTSTSQTSLASSVLTDDAEISIDIDSAGTAASGLKVTLYYHKA